MRTYEELQGAGGREVFYRAERFKAADVFKRGRPNVLVDDESCTLQDLSLTGLSAVARRGSNVGRHLGQLVSVQIEAHNVALFEGRGEIVRIEPDAAGKRIGIRLFERCLDLSQLMAKYQSVLVQSDFADWEGPYATITPEYRQFCADVVYLMRTYRAGLDRFEAMQPDACALDDMFAKCEQQIIPRWRALWERGNELVTPIIGNKAVWEATKRFSETVLTPDFLPGPFVRRAYDKPLGYPGDYECMNMVYNWRREGERLYDQIAHRLGLDVTECIANRMTLMRRAIAETVSTTEEGPARITSLGCGPAREVIDYLKIAALPGRVEFTLVDQDNAALAQVYERSVPEVMRHRGCASVTCLHSSFAQLMKAGELFGKLPAQDLIYSLGLLDYLSARRAKSLVESLYEQLAPGGKLIIANMKSGGSSLLWPAEFITDWTLIYRDHKQMLELGADLEGASLQVADDQSGRVCVLTVSKPTQA